MSNQPTSYCQFVEQEGISPLHSDYHDTEYGYPLETDNELFCRLVLEINQAGLSWLTILKKKHNFIEAFEGFDIATVAAYNENDIERLMSNAGIIRNRLKIKAAIHNANVIKQLQKDYGSFAAWLDHHHPLDRVQWTALFKKTFTFTGGEIVNEFLMSTGYLPGAHQENCPVFEHILTLQPRWTQSS